MAVLNCLDEKKKVRLIAAMFGIVTSTAPDTVSVHYLTLHLMVES